MKSPTALQHFLRTEVDACNKLTEDFGVEVTYHPTLPLANFKYNMINALKTHEIVRCSRGTILEVGSWKLIAQPFRRFFNWFEGPTEEMDYFNWNDFYCNTKEDGSLISLFWYENSWHCSTSGSFAQGDVNPLYKGSWEELFFDTLQKELRIPNETEEKTIGGPSLWQFNLNFSYLFNKNYTYIFELCSQWNKIIRNYPNPEVYLLGVTNIEHDPYEFNQNYVTEIANELGLKRPETYNFKSFKEIEAFLIEKELSDPSFEGVVIVDTNGFRFKIKNKAYLNLHQMHNNGHWSYKHVLAFILREDTEEMLLYFPEAKSIVNEMKAKVELEYNKLKEVWKDTFKIQDQKQFALNIVPRTKFSSLLFTLRKEKEFNQNEVDLYNIWKNSEDLILKVLFKNLLDKKD